MDFYEILERKTNGKPPKVTLYPDFKYAHVKDIVCKGGAMYAFWDGERWNQNLSDMIVQVDRAIFERVRKVQDAYPDRQISGLYFNNSGSKVMKEFDSYTKLIPQSDQQFNTKIFFDNHAMEREDYATTKLNYTPTEGDTPVFDELMTKLYDEDELKKIFWFMGALLTNNMHNIQKFMYLYGGKGTGKGTAIKIIKMMFEGYHAPINLKTLTGNSEFATSQITEVPLLIDEDSDMSKITNDTYLLKMTSHEPVAVNAKYRKTYDVIFNGLLITASNRRFKVRNIDSGITRRAVVVKPTNKKHESDVYKRLMAKVIYEIPYIANRAMELFEAMGPYYYENHVDVEMAEATDHIFSFVRQNVRVLGDPCSLKKASELYKVYLDDIGYDTNGYKRVIKNELARYYENFYDERRVDGDKQYNVFTGMKRHSIFPEEDDVPLILEEDADEVYQKFKMQDSIFDERCKSYPAQYATSAGTPKDAWDKNRTTLGDLNTSKLHYVRVPMDHIVIDFDIVGEDGEKNLEKNLIASQKFPETYTELSKSGKGVHLHYIYDGDVTKLASLYEDDVEIKVFSGKQSLRRRLTLCTDTPIAHISTGLPTKEEGVKVYKDVEIIAWNEKKMRTAVKGNLEKKYHDATKPSVDFIAHIFEEAEKNGIKYDLRDMRQDILAFASQSSNNTAYCLKVVSKINFCTIDDVVDTPKMQAGGIVTPDEDLVFYDVEVFPNLFIVCYKRYGDEEVTKLINPTSEEVERLVGTSMVGFNNRRYDNHILYARLIGEDNQSLYRQSQRIITDKDARSGMYSGAYELSYADIYDYASKKQSLKKWEIELGIKHDELELPWDQPVPEDMWERVADYCVNDVIATEEVFKATYSDYTARLILSTLSGLKVNATTTQHAAAFLFGTENRPQEKFHYTDLSERFPGYTFSYGKSEYRGEDPGEGGYVYSEPGVYNNVALLDVASMHPTSLIEMNYFGPFTKIYKELMDTRLAIKHGNYEKAAKAFNGMLKPFLHDEKSAKELSYALKIIINIVYGMTSAKFDNKFKHPKNLDNIVAKRGALFMIDLKHAVQEKGYTVAHIKTDSIKIPDADQEIIDFVFKMGEDYGYTFEHEETYDAIALVNKAVYIAKAKDHWEAVGAQFAEPYVYKRLFTKEPIAEDDYALTKQATAPIYLGEHFVGKVARVYASKSGEEMMRVTDEKTSAISGTKNFRWRLMSEYKGKDDIDMSYYNGLVEDAIKAIDKVGDREKLFGEDPGDLPF